MTALCDFMDASATPKAYLKAVTNLVQLHTILVNKVWAGVDTSGW